MEGFKGTWEIDKNRNNNKLVKNINFIIRLYKDN